MTLNKPAVRPSDIFASTASVKRVWIDADNFAVGAIANGATIANEFDAALPFTVVGTTLSVQVNAEGRKEFVFDGNTFLQCADQNAFADLHKVNTTLTIFFTGKVGTSSNPDAVYGLCGNNGTSTTNIGMCVMIENRVAQAATHGWRLFISKGVSNDAPITSIWDYATFNTRQSVHILHAGANTVDVSRLFINAESVGPRDRSRSTANTTSGLGTARTYSAANPTYKFEIGAAGNGTIKFVGKIEELVIFAGLMTSNAAKEVVKGMKVVPSRSAETSLYIRIHQTITNGYILGGTYAKNADRSKTVFISSTGPNHFTPGSDREGCITTSTDDGWNWPAFSSIWTDPANAVHGGVCGGYTATGRLLVAYGRYSASTGAYNALIVRYSDDDGATWSSENSITIPTTSPALTAYVAMEKLVICDNGDMIIPWYGISGTSLYKVYVMRTSDNGATWTHNEMYSSTTAYVNETSVENLGGGYILGMCRIETINGSSFEYRQMISSNHGVTWTHQGNTNLGFTLYVYPHPPMLRKFTMNGVRVIAMYFVNRGTRRWHVIYCKASDLISSGTSAWTGKPSYILDTRLGQLSTTGWVSGYPFVIHPDDDIRAEGVYFDETSSSVATVNFFKIGNEHAAAVATALGI